MEIIERRRFVDGGDVNPGGVQISRGEPAFVVAVGASAGSLDACRRFFGSVPAKSGMAFVVVTHLDPTRDSHLADILARSTSMTVVQVTDAMPLEPDSVFVIAPGTSLRLRDRAATPALWEPAREGTTLVDVLFEDIARECGERCAAVVLSGTGSDGSAGIRAVKASGGLCLAQDPLTAEYDGMPRSAIATGAVDEILHPEGMPEALMHRAESPRGDVWQASRVSNGEPRTVRDDILWLLTRVYGVGFRASYKSATLERRIERRMQLQQIADLDAYYRRLQCDPEELAGLYGDLLIGVTQFFRDPDIWELLSQEILPSYLEQQEPEAPVKVWVPGCATGEEAYSLAMVLVEQLERLKRPNVLHVFATDVAGSALATARRGVYGDAIRDHVSPDRIERFFRRDADGLRVSRELRENVTFALHNLLVDPPFSGCDLVSCRNVLIYLEAHAQSKVIDVFRFACKPGGLLVLGSTETLGARLGSFEPVSGRASVYRAVKPRGASGVAHGWSQAASVRKSSSIVPSGIPRRRKVNRIVEQLVLSRCTLPCVALNEAFEIQAFYGPTHEYLAQPTGEARMELLAWARPHVYPGLREGLERAKERDERVVVEDIYTERDGELLRSECVIEPITPLPDTPQMYLVSFRELVKSEVLTDGTAAMTSATPLIRELESELTRTREDLKNSLEQLESGSDAYRASLEELISLNEELQASNEELEASKAELSSVNEELEATNRELRARNLEIESVKTDLDNLLSSTKIPIIFLDRRLSVRRFTPAATELMRLVESDVGRPVEHIKERFDDPRLVDDAKTVLRTLAPITTEVCGESGRFFSRTIVPYRTEDDRIEGVCVSFHDVTERKAEAKHIQDARDYSEAIVATVRTALLVLDSRLRVVTANDAFCETFGLERDGVETASLFEMDGGAWNLPALRDLLRRVAEDGGAPREVEVEHDSGRGRRVLCASARKMPRPDDALVLLAIEDVTAERQIQRLTEARASELTEEHRRKDEFLAMLGHELRNPLAALMHGLDLIGFTRDDPAQLDRIRATMLRQARRISSMLDQLLDIARLTAGKIQMDVSPLNVVAACEAAIEAVMPLVERRAHTLVTSLPSEDVLVLGDQARLTQVVENLLTNAAKYTHDGGNIHLSVEADAASVRVSVADDGSGIEPELLPHVFELFTQAPRTLERAAGGLGLGLPLVKQVVEMHEGTVVAKSAGLDQGTEVTVTLPRMRDRRASSRPRAAQRTRDDGFKILVVDDEEDMATMLADLLASKGHEARVTHEGMAALETVRSFHPRVVLLDLGLPGIDGYEVARRLRSEFAEEELMLVAVTGYQADQDRLREVGFDHHMLKPPDMPRLYGWLEELQR